MHIIKHRYHELAKTVVKKRLILNKQTIEEATLAILLMF